MICQYKKISLLLFALIPAWSFAQTGGGTLPTESVDVLSEFNVRLQESNKVDVAPSLPVLDTTTQRQTYTVPPYPAVLSYEAPNLRPIGMKSVKGEDPYNGFVKAGGGVPTSIWGEAGYHYNGEDFDLRAWLRHHTLNADRSIENQRFFNNDVLLNGNVFLENNLAVEGKIGYSFDRYHFYGYDHDSLEFESEAVRQDYKLLTVGGRLYNSERTDADLNFSVAPNFYVLNDYYSNGETGFDLNLSGTKWFAEKHPLRLTLRTDFTTYEDTITQKLNNIYLQPSFTYHSDIFRLKVGGNFASNRDIFSIFPDVELTLRIFGDGFQIFAGANGDLRKNTFRSISEYNPFIEMRRSELRNTRWDNYYGGIRGNLGFLEYSGQVGYSRAADLALFQTFFTGEGITRFRTVYDTATMVNIQGTVKIIPFSALTISGTLSVIPVFDLENEATHWGLPQLEGNFQANYSLLEGKALLNAGLYVADGIPRLDVEGTEGRDQALVDLNVGGQYYFTDNIGAFLNINNILNNKRERWHNYPMVGLNFLIGVTARF